MLRGYPTDHGSYGRPFLLFSNLKISNSYWLDEIFILQEDNNVENEMQEVIVQRCECMFRALRVS